MSRTLLSILTDFNCALVWMVSLCPLYPKSSSPFTKSFGYCSKCTNYNWYHCYLHVHSCFFFFSSLARSRYLSLFRFILILLCGLPGRQSLLFCMFSFFIFLFRWLSLGLVVWPRLDDPFVSKDHKRRLCFAFSRIDSGLCIYYCRIEFNFYLISSRITFLTLSCLDSFCTNLLYYYYYY